MKRKRCKRCKKLIDPKKLTLMQFRLLEKEEILCCVECSHKWAEAVRVMRWGGNNGYQTR